MKITIETCANTVPNEVAEGLEARVKTSFETPEKTTTTDDPVCCEACGLKQGVSLFNRIVFNAEITLLERVMHGMPPQPPPFPGDEWTGCHQ